LFRGSLGLFLGEEAARTEMMGQLEAVMGAQAVGAVETAILNSRIE
jgi:hypothetical protein